MLKSFDFTLLSLISAAFARADIVVSSTYCPVVSSWLNTLHPTVENRVTAARVEILSEARMAESSWRSEGEPWLGKSLTAREGPASGQLAFGSPICNGGSTAPCPH